MKSCINYFKNL